MAHACAAFMAARAGMASLDGTSKKFQHLKTCFTFYEILQFPKGKGNPMRTESIVSSKGQVTLPAAMRAELGIQAGSRIGFEVRGNELVIKPELPMSAYYGMLKDFELGEMEPPKEADRGFE
jgi:AbrB family looped-hinge helix DNA binding protein